MQTQGIVQIIAAADGAAIAEAIRAQLSAVTSVAAETIPTTLPLPHENAVLVFVLTDQATADPAVGAYAALAAGSRFAILPVVPTRTGFDFRTLTGDLAFLGKLNAIGWDEGATPGAAVITAIRRYLGLEPFERDCRLFISYRRSDGSAAAEAIYRHLRAREFDAFMDTKHARGRRKVAKHKRPGQAVLVHRGRPLSKEEQRAVDWARRKEPLHVLALDQVVPFFLSLHAPA